MLKKMLKNTTFNEFINSKLRKGKKLDDKKSLGMITFYHRYNAI